RLPLERGRKLVEEHQQGAVALQRCAAHRRGLVLGVSVTADSGQPYGNLVGTKWMRDGQGHIVVDSTSGLPIRDSRQVVLGNYNPDWVGGITNTLSYKNLSLSFSFDGQLGGHVYSVTKWFGQYSGV